LDFFCPGSFTCTKKTKTGHGLPPAQLNAKQVRGPLGPTLAGTPSFLRVKGKAWAHNKSCLSV
jgi:hypothetical protein